MKLFKQSIAFSLFLCLAAGHANVYAAASSSCSSSSSSSSSYSGVASSVPVEPAIEYHDSGLPTRLADYLAETPFFKWLGNKITTYALEAHEARQSNTIKNRQALVKKKYAKHYFETGKPVDIESFKKELSECEKALPEYHPTSSEYYPTSSATLAPKTFGQWALVIMCITAPFLPQNNCPFDDQKDEIPELSEAGKEIAGLARYGRKHRFDVCHQRPGDLQQCCTIHDNTRIECCLIDKISELEICESINLRGYPSKTRSFKTDALLDESPITKNYHTYDYEVPLNGYSVLYEVISYPFLQQLHQMITTKTPLTVADPLVGFVFEYQATPNRSFIRMDITFFTHRGSLLCVPFAIAHELGHHQQYSNNPDLLGFIKTNTIPPHDYKTLRAFNIEFNADIHAYLLLESIENNPLLLLLDKNMRKDPISYFFNAHVPIVHNQDSCSLHGSLTEHPDILTCRLPLLAELHEKYPVLLKELEEKMERARAEQSDSQ
ncbi:hypothetical protein K2W90_06355 [Candidatus Babeliales bacterium]|nr:hypothetical protein [Candidatus Babeliales bacterium]